MDISGWLDLRDATRQWISTKYYNTLLIIRFLFMQLMLRKFAMEMDEDLKAVFPDDYLSLRSIRGWFEGFPNPHQSLQSRYWASFQHQNREKHRVKDLKISVRKITVCPKIVCSVWLQHDLTEADEREPSVKQILNCLVPRRKRKQAQLPMSAEDEKRYLCRRRPCSWRPSSSTIS